MVPRRLSRCYCRFPSGVADGFFKHGQAEKASAKESGGSIQQRDHGQTDGVHSRQQKTRPHARDELSGNTDPVLVIGTVKWVRRLSDSEQYRVGLSYNEVISGSPKRLDRYFAA